MGACKNGIIFGILLSRNTKTFRDFQQDLVYWVSECVSDSDVMLWLIIFPSYDDDGFVTRNNFIIQMMLRWKV